MGTGTILRPTPDQIRDILAKHAAYLRCEVDGVRADLRGADLRGANLGGADLGGANLYGADLRGANLRGANLRGANLYGADLYGADLRGANLYGADLRGADLGGADLGGADLRGANLYGANNLDAGVALRRQIVPQEGSFRAFKKVWSGAFAGRVAVLEIPEDAQRIGGLLGRKCRASKATVLGFLKGKDEPDTESAELQSQHDSTFKYRVGETVEPKNGFCDDPTQECAPGIHFFLSYEEAEEYMSPAPTPPNLSATAFVRRRQKHERTVLRLRHRDV